MKVCFRELQKRALPLISAQAPCTIDCTDWSPEQVKKHVMGFGEFCHPLANAMFEYRINGFAMRHTPPRSILSDLQEHLSNITDKLDYYSSVTFMKDFEA